MIEKPVYTLNTIAIYLGFDNWETYLKAKNIDSEWGLFRFYLSSRT